MTVSPLTHVPLAAALVPELQAPQRCAEAEAALILVVDDLESNALMLEGMLQAGGYRTLIATDGPTALACARRHEPRLILLDLVMPGVSGVETCRMLKQTDWGQAIPVVFVTGASDKSSLVEAFGAGGVDYLSKPVYPQELLARIGVHLRLREAEEELKTRNHELEDTAQQLSLTNDRLAQLSRTDGLTGLLNRRTWDDEAQRIHATSARYKHVYSVMMLDVDLFKPYNDRYGHQAGDECLVRVAHSMSQALRQVDLVGRYGGEEFIALLPQTPVDVATQAAERVRESIWNLHLPHEGSPAQRVTISIGVADNTGRTLATAIGAADHGLYMAKRHGRNVVIGPTVPHLKPTLPDPPEDSTVGAASATSGEPVKHVIVIGADASVLQACRAQLDDRKFCLHAGTHAFGDDVRQTQIAWAAIVLDLRGAEAQATRLLGQIRAGSVTRFVPVIGICHQDAEAVRRAIDWGCDDVVDDLVCSYQLEMRIAAACRLCDERTALEQSYQLRGDQVRVLAYTIDCAQRASEARTFEELCGVLLQGASEIAAAPYSAIYFSRTGGPTPTAVTWDSQREAPLDVAAGHQISAELCDQLLQADVVIEPARRAEKLPRSAYGPEEFSAGLHLRLEVGGEQLGVLSVYRQRVQHPFTEQEVELYRVFACLTASILSESLYHRARDEAVNAFVKALATTAESRDGWAAQHVHRIARVSRLIAERLRSRGYGEPISDEFIEHLVLAAPLHDIGNVAVPDAILRKAGKLSVHEMAVMKTHCALGTDLFVRLINDAHTLPFASLAMDVISSHHERFDGQGYPQGLSGTAIPLAGRIVALADAYDAITNKRTYREARTHAEALRIIEQDRGSQFDPAVVDAFLDCADAIQATG